MLYKNNGFCKTTGLKLDGTRLIFFKFGMFIVINLWTNLYLACKWGHLTVYRNLSL